MDIGLGSLLQAKKIFSELDLIMRQLQISSVLYDFLDSVEARESVSNRYSAFGFLIIRYE